MAVSLRGIGAFDNSGTGSYLSKVKYYFFGTIGKARVNTAWHQGYLSLWCNHSVACVFSFRFPDYLSTWEHTTVHHATA
jgi:hypothetical protein